MIKGVCVVFIILVLAECARIDSRQNAGRKEPRSRSKITKSRVTRNRGDVFENFFNIYDPSFLAVVWPKINNGVHLFVNRACWSDLSVFFRDLIDGRAWAYHVVDASGRYQTGLFEGNRLWLGSKKECLQLDEAHMVGQGNVTLEDSTVMRREKYFDGEDWRDQALGPPPAAPPLRVAYSAARLVLNITKPDLAKSFDITLGMCLPRACGEDDVASIVTFSIMLTDNFKSNNTIQRDARVTSVRRISQYDVTTDTAAFALILATVFLLVIAVSATCVDLKLVKRPRHNSSRSFDLHKFNNNNMGARNDRPATLPRKESNVVGTETLTINNINNANNINLVTVKKVMKPNALPPSITLDVVSMAGRTDGVTGSCMRCGKYKKQCTSFRNPDNLSACPRVKSYASLTEPRDEKLMKSLFLCFSLNYSWKRIFNTNMANKDLAIVHGMRIAATFGIIFVHVAMLASNVSEDGGDINGYNNIYYIMVTGTLAFDTLFFVSGVLSAHHFFYLRSQYSVEELVSFGGTAGRALQVICFVTNRAIRLLPSYVYAILLSGVASRAASRTAAAAAPSADGRNCDMYWWRNLLYVSTVFPKEEECMQVSWLLSTETQLHLLAALWCALATAARRAAPAAAAAALLAAAAADVAGAAVDGGIYLANSLVAYSALVERPLARVAPYFIGVFGGWLVHRADGRVAMSKTKSSLLWVASVFLAASSLSLPWLASRWVAAAMHLIWSAALLWPTLLLATNLAWWVRGWCGGGVAAALSRLSYGAVLLHIPIAHGLLLGADAALCTQGVCLWWYFSGVLSASLCGALALALLVETPACSLLRRLSDCTQ